MNTQLWGRRRSACQYGWLPWLASLVLPVSARAAGAEPGIVGQAFIVFVVLMILTVLAARGLSRIAERDQKNAGSRAIFMQVVLFGFLCSVFVSALMVLFASFFSRF